jgi:hypothetical protein
MDHVFCSFELCLCDDGNGTAAGHLTRSGVYCQFVCSYIWMPKMIAFIYCEYAICCCMFVLCCFFKNKMLLLIIVAIHFYTLVLFGVQGL